MTRREEKEYNFYTNQLLKYRPYWEVATGGGQYAMGTGGNIITPVFDNKLDALKAGFNLMMEELQDAGIKHVAVVMSMVDRLTGKVTEIGRSIDGIDHTRRELNRIDVEADVSVQVRAGGVESFDGYIATKWLNINKDSAKALVHWLTEKYLSDEE